MFSPYHLVVPWMIACSFCDASSSPSPSSTASTITTTTKSIYATVDDTNSIDSETGDFDDSKYDSDEVNLCDLIESLEGSTPTPDPVRLETDPRTGVRGVYVNRFVSEGEVLFWIPLSSCLRYDDEDGKDLDEDGEDLDEDGMPTVAIRGWVTRLATSLLNLTTDDRAPLPSAGIRTWMNLLPAAPELRRSLPVHWDLHSLQNDSSSSSPDYGAGITLLLHAAAAAQKARIPSFLTLRSTHPSATAEECNWALDLVQTRSISFHQAATTKDGTAGIVRLLPPVVDMINHNPMPNAEFGIFPRPEETGDDDSIDRWVIAVRATEDLDQNTELFLRYGPVEGLPAWKCLLCYGFVPTETEEEEAAEFVVVDKGGRRRRFEVSVVEIPEGLIRWEACRLEGEKVGMDNDEDGPVELTAEVGQEIISRLEQVVEGMDCVNTEEDGDREVGEAMLDRLRETRRGIFLECARGLREYLDNRE